MADPSNTIGFFILEAVVFTLGLAICGLGMVPLSRRRSVRGSPAYLVGVILMLPLPFYLIMCQQTGLPAAGPLPPGFQGLKPLTVKLVGITAFAVSAACILAAGVLAAVSSEVRSKEALPPAEAKQPGEPSSKESG
ncbi:MAG TPA: hypothetical protein VFA18_18225 [Gemmataceae bacterium]|nr:hypothetical protein [Gemmataceae bacterium]